MPDDPIETTETPAEREQRRLLRDEKLDEAMAYLDRASYRTAEAHERVLHFKASLDAALEDYHRKKDAERILRKRLRDKALQPIPDDALEPEPDPEPDPAP